MNSGKQDKAKEKSQQDPQGDKQTQGDKQGVNESYLVLARKYRPQKFSDLVGQDVLVKVFQNAIAEGKVHHAFLLTGIRGTGKTSAARLIAKALNCHNQDGSGEPCCECPSCESIATGHSLDVIELDAASQTSVDDIRQIIDATQYKPVNSPYKVYIIDEVHMLSASAFNALLKTLEEPPSKVVFILATTEFRKVPATVQSRCMRFGLRRVTTENIRNVMAKILKEEKWEFSDEALLPIARSATGSIRDALSMLEQAMALAIKDKNIQMEHVRQMLGLSDISLLHRLLESALCANIAQSLNIVQDIYHESGSPAGLLQDMLGALHSMAMQKHLSKDDKAQDDLLAEEKEFFARMAEKLSMADITRAWQILLKGQQELLQSIDPKQALDMIIVRLAYAASLPSPAEIIKELKNPEANPEANQEANQAANPEAGKEASAKTDAQADTQAPQAEAEFPASFEALAEMARAKEDLPLLNHLTRNLKLVEYSPPKLVFTLQEGVQRNLPRLLAKSLAQLTAREWQIEAIEESEVAQRLLELNPKPNLNAKPETTPQTKSAAETPQEAAAPPAAEEAPQEAPQETPQEAAQESLEESTNGAPQESVKESASAPASERMTLAQQQTKKERDALEAASRMPVVEQIINETGAELISAPDDAGR